MFGCGFSVFPNGYCPERLVLGVRLLRQGLVGAVSGIRKLHP